ncbi:unnamed protein product [Cyprideis torosa]|uniref:Uncharacterized protein n=1 Tax=Cyprideis torosa TaxID=163714 RepID=A0A7R8ZVY6_9CRUS|nr:unnamed protein product [Cyprideis torosa]CAG0908231.1 unnamed protein product [Cyprideis torosa]
MKDQRNTSSSVLSMVPGIRDDGKVLQCIAENPRFPQHVVKDAIRLNIQYPPTLKVELGHNLDPSDIRTHHDVYFNCVTRANPEVNDLFWVHNEKYFRRLTGEVFQMIDKRSIPDD